MGGQADVSLAGGDHAVVLELAIAAAAGFLLAVLWFDLMFDVQVSRHRREPTLPEDVLASIAAYYRRVTTTASPMGRLVGLVMVVLLVSLVAQVVEGDVPTYISVISLWFAVLAVGFAIFRIFGQARRLGARVDSIEEQSRLAKRIADAHVVCFSFMSMVLAVQLIGAS